MPLESLFSTIAEAAFDYLLQESGLAERARAVLESGRKIFRPDPTPPCVHLTQNRVKWYRQNS